jgi:hypothetical protein
MTKNKPSLQEKEQNSHMTIEETSSVDFSDALAIDPELKREIASQGLVCRWINGAKHAANYGFDARMWTPYKRKSEGKSSAYGYTDSEGFVRRGDLILAVQSTAVFNKRKEIVERRNLANKAAIGSKEAARAIRQKLKESGLSSKQVKVLEGDESEEA